MSALPVSAGPPVSAVPVSSGGTNASIPSASLSAASGVTAESRAVDPVSAPPGVDEEHPANVPSKKRTKIARDMIRV